MSKTPDAVLTALFNQYSGKIIDGNEYIQKEKALWKKNATRSERMFARFVDTPVYLLAAGPSLCKDFFKTVTGNNDDAYIDLKTRESYLDAKSLVEVAYDWASRGPNKKFQEKQLQIQLQALEECEDFAPLVKLGIIHKIKFKKK